jgi:hypothetical protein
MSLILSGTDGLSDVDGSAATPAIRGTDANTGIFFPAADTIAFAEGGAEAMRLDSSGNVGVGTSSPTQKLDVAGQVTISSGNGYLWGNGAVQIYSNSSYLRFRTASTDRLEIDSSGNLGLGVTPSAWSQGKAFEISAVGEGLWGNGLGDIWMLNGAYFNGGFKYSGSTKATAYRQGAGTTDGSHSWHVAGSGTAGNAITFTQAMTLDASGNLIINDTSRIGSARLSMAVNASTENLFAFKTTTNGEISALRGLNSAGSEVVAINYDTTNSALLIRTGSTERARITSAGDLMVGKTTLDASTVGCILRFNGEGVFVASSVEPLTINRKTSDGTLVSFCQDNTQEGTISVSGTTVSYNGGHLSRWAQTTTAKDESLVKGTVLSNLDEMNSYTDAEGSPVANEQLNKVKVSDIEGDSNVAGVFVNWTHDDAHDVDEINMAMTGDMIIRIAQGVTVARGDLLMSAGDGTAKPQGDDIVRSKTVAKVTSTHVTCTYADGSYCVPCVLMAC